MVESGGMDERIHPPITPKEWFTPWRWFIGDQIGCLAGLLILAAISRVVSVIIDELWNPASDLRKWLLFF